MRPTATQRGRREDREEAFRVEGPLAVVGSAEVVGQTERGGGADRCPAESTVSEILRRHGLSGLVKRRRRAVPTEQPFEECREANAVWCTDFKGWFRTTNGRKCTPLTISDAHSRCLLCCQGLGGATGFITVKLLFIKTFRECGLPDAMRTDNGPPLASRPWEGSVTWRCGGCVWGLNCNASNRVARNRMEDMSDASDAEGSDGPAAASESRSPAEGV